MCLLTLAINGHPDFPLVFAGNRDEYHARPSLPADWWTDTNTILGGRDLEAGGTWLAINRAGSLGVVTNRPDLPAPDQHSRSRGELVTGWLSKSENFTKLPQQHMQYGGFSLLLADSNNLQLLSGGNGTARLTTHSAANGVTGLSNTAPDQPWPKLTWLNQQLLTHLKAKQPDIEHLMSLLARSIPVPDSTAPDSSNFDNSKQGVPATPFVTGEQYGTRCSTVITISRQGKCQFIERSFGPGGTAAGESAYSFNLEV
jgi:uncharacterized protein with NRDE domain